MGKAGRARALSRRDKVAAQQAAAQRDRRRNRMLAASGGVGLVVVLLVVLALVRPGRLPASATAADPSTGTAAQATAVTRQIAGLPAATLNAVGPGNAGGLSATSGQPRLTADGKPEVLYLGGEFCPFCAAERWALAAALSRFGTFSGVGLIHSSPADSDPSTPTLTFAAARYTSRYLDFTPVEWFGEADDASSPFGHVIRQQPTAAQAGLFSRYGGGSIPFIDFGNQYLLPQAQYDPADLHGLTWSEVAAAMRDPASTTARDIDGSANVMTAAACRLTGGQPGAVCSSAGVTSAAGALSTPSTS